MSTISVQVSFHGEAVRSGLMDVRDLSPALLAVGEIFEGANQSLNGGRATISVRVQAQFRGGSFNVDLHVLQSIVENAPAFLEMPSVVTAVELARLLGFEAGQFISLLQLIKWLKGRLGRMRADQDGNIIVNAGRDVTIVHGDLIQIYENPSVRAALPRLVAPLRQRGIDRLVVGTDSENAESVEEDEAAFFEDTLLEPAETDENESTNSSRRMLGIVSIHFKRHRKWRLTDGRSTIWVEVADQAFADRVRRHEVVFGVGDVLDLELEAKTVLTDTGIKTTYRVTKVFNHIPAPRQATF